MKISDCEQTLEGNMQENYDKFLQHLPTNAYIRDFECGSGRDSKYFIIQKDIKKSNFSHKS